MSELGKKLTKNATDKVWLSSINKFCKNWRLKVFRFLALTAPKKGQLNQYEQTW
jgi:hypothetical protein